MVLNPINFFFGSLIRRNRESMTLEKETAHLYFGRRRARRLKGNENYSQLESFAIFPIFLTVPERKLIWLKKYYLIHEKLDNLQYESAGQTVTMRHGVPIFRRYRATLAYGTYRAMHERFNDSSFVFFVRREFWQDDIFWAAVGLIELVLMLLSYSYDGFTAFVHLFHRFF